MKISQINIKNFKSIDLLDNFTINDDKVCCFIGKNGSGKSNLLIALDVLKNNNNLVDSNRYEKADKDEQIEIGASILFDDDDLSLLEPHGLNLTNIKGFKITVRKSVGDEPIREFEALGFDNKNENKVINKLSKIKSAINKIPLVPEKENERKSILENLKLEKKSKDTLKDSLDKAIVFFNSKIQGDEDAKQKFHSLVDDLKKHLEFNILAVIEKEIWPKLSIVLLNPNTYKIKNSCQRTELEDDSKHKFLFDLLALSGKLPKDLDRKGSELVNICKDISGTLTENLKSVWEAHELIISIARQANEIYFMFKTPQERSLELTNLSEGQMWFLRFYTALAISKLKGQKVIWLFDEPGQTLHASSQINLKEYFEAISENSQIFYTTHQPMMIPWDKLERIFLVENIKKQGTKIPDRLWKDEELESPLREALALFVGEEMLTGVQHVLVEGPSDYIYLQGWLRFFKNTRKARRWDESYSITNRSFVPTGGKNSMPLYLLFLTHQKRLISAIALPDTSADEKEIKESINKLGIDPTHRKAMSFESILKGTEIFGIEDIFEVQEYLKEVQEFYNLKFPKIVFPKNFLSPKKKDLEKGICSYTTKVLKTNDSNVSIDKPGIALNIYRKLIRADSDIFSVSTKKKFEKILGSVDKEFKNLKTFQKEQIEKKRSSLEKKKK